MPRRRVAGEKTQRVAVDEMRFLGRDGRPFGVVDARIDREAGGLAGLGQLDRAFDRHAPRMPQIQIRDVAREQLGIGQPGAIVGRGEARDRQRGVHGIAHRLRRKIGAAGVPLLLADIDRDAHALVTVVLYGFDLAAAHGHGLAETFARLGLGGISAALFRIIEGVLGNLLERVGAV